MQARTAREAGGDKQAILTFLHCTLIIRFRKMFTRPSLPIRVGHSREHFPTVLRRPRYLHFRAAPRRNDFALLH